MAFARYFLLTLLCLTCLSFLANACEEHEFPQVQDFAQEPEKAASEPVDMNPIPAICGKCGRAIMPGDAEGPSHDGKRFHANDCRDVTHFVLPPPVKPMGPCGGCGSHVLPSEAVFAQGQVYHRKCAMERGIVNA